MLTLLEAAKLITNPLASGIVETIPSVNPVLERLPYIDIGGTAYRYNREQTLPGIGFRSINAAFPESTGVINPQVESLTILGGDMDFDRALVAMGAGSNDIRAAHTLMKTKAMSLKHLKTYFDGDSVANPEEFDGLNGRLTGNQLKQLSSGGATLSLDDLDDLIDRVQGGPDVLLMNKTMRRKVSKLIRAAGQAIETVSDSFGRQIQAYAGIPIGIVEQDHEDNDILGFDEDDGTGNLDTTSIYAARFGLDTHHGIQTAPIDVRDLGEIDAKPVLRTRVEWYSGIVLKHPRAAARMSRINNA